MKIETLNIWGGRVYEPLIEHLKQQSADVDIFCFQEVYRTPESRIFTREVTEENGVSPYSNLPPERADIYQQIANHMPQFKGHFRSAQSGFDCLGPANYELYYGLAIFVRNEIEIKEEGEIFVYREKDSSAEGDNSTMGRNLQFVKFNNNGKDFTVANLHGLWNGNGKGDAPERIEQSRKVKMFLDSMGGAKILCGDFNLAPDTESLAILEQDMKNLVKEYGVTSTRSNFYTKPEKFADYILVSPEVKVIDFKVLQVPVSDHLPLLLQFS